MLPCRIELTEDDAGVTAYAGLPMVVEMMRALGVSEQIDRQLGIRKRDAGATDAQKAEAIVLLLTACGTCRSEMTEARGSIGGTVRVIVTSRPHAARSE
jgi:hypothetical protein